MGAKPLDIHPAALEELKSALVWYLERSETAAGNFAAELDGPSIWSLVPQDAGQVVNTQLGNSSYSVFRLPSSIGKPEATIQVLAIAHGHRRPGYWKERL